MTIARAAADQAESASLPALRERVPDMRRIYSAGGLLRCFKERVGRILSASELPVKSGTCRHLIELPVFVGSLNVLIGFCAELF